MALFHGLLHDFIRFVMARVVVSLCVRFVFDSGVVDLGVGFAGLR